MLSVQIFSFYFKNLCEMVFYIFRFVVQFYQQQQK